MRRHASFAQLVDEIADIIAAIRTQSHPLGPAWNLIHHRQRRLPLALARGDRFAAGSTLVSGMLLYMRSIFDHAVVKKIIQVNPARNPGYQLKAKSRKQASEHYLSLEECRGLLFPVSGVDHLAIRILIQLGLRSEELFALRRDDVLDDMLRIDEALVAGAPAPVKTDASDASVYLPRISNWS